MKIHKSADAASPRDPAQSGTSTSAAHLTMSRLSVAERQAQGRALRAQTPRRSHASWKEPPDRPDPVALLESQASTRLPDLLPLRYARMQTSPFAFLRGSAIVMAHDLARTPVTGIYTQLCGDCHIANFGGYTSPE